MTAIIQWLKNLIQLFDYSPNLDETPPKTPPKTPREQEPANLYCKGGYHPVNIGDTYRDRYIVLQKLGWGSFSTVWQCWDKQNSQFIALKIVRSSSSCTKSALREIQLLECVQQHQSNNPGPHKLVQLLDHFLISGVNGRHICMAFEALGPNLREIMLNNGAKGFPLTTVKAILRQILEAVDYLHTTCNIMHADIKPDNVCVNEIDLSELAKWEEMGVKFPSPRTVDAGHEMPVTLVDLGIAVRETDHLVNVIQTLPYRGPEIILGGEFRANADVWSTACLAFELATGHYLFCPFSRDKRFTDEEYHLALITGLLGDVPERIAFASEYSCDFFTAGGKLRYDPKVKSCGLFERLSDREFGLDASEARRFAEFLLPMLAMDPNDRCSARDCLEHEWLKL